MAGYFWNSLYIEDDDLCFSEYVQFLLHSIPTIGFYGNNGKKLIFNSKTLRCRTVQSTNLHFDRQFTGFVGSVHGDLLNGKRREKRKLGFLYNLFSIQYIKRALEGGTF